MGFFDQGLQNHWDRQGPMETSDFLQFSVGNQALSTPKMVQKCVQNGLKAPKSPSYACCALLKPAPQKRDNAFFGEDRSIFALEGAAECPGQLLPSTFSSHLVEDFIWVLEKGEMASVLEAECHLSHGFGLTPIYTHDPPSRHPHSPSTEG